MIEVACIGLAPSEIEVLKYQLYPYEVRLSADIDAADVIICRETPRRLTKPTIRICKEDNRTTESKNNPESVVDIQYDLDECLARYERVMEPSISMKYKLATKLPVPYNIIPSSIRARFLKRRKIDANLSKHLRNELARVTLVDAFGRLGISLRRRAPPALLITHDIDSERGLRRTEGFCKVEGDLDVTSTWFLPSDEYPISRTDAKKLGESSRIGSHDVKHDGKLIHIKSYETLVQRLVESKSRLESVFGVEVACFRSPLMQFSRNILRALADAGYKSDFSLPCWEPVHPTTMGGFGVETAHSFEVGNVMECPLTLFQDHQVLSVLGMTVREAVRFWVEQATLIHALGGNLVLLIHPDYAFADDMQAYRSLLESLLQIQHSPCPDS